MAHGDLDAQINAVTKLIDSDPRNAQLYLRRGELHRVHQAWKAAEADYDRAAQLDPKFALVDACRGKMLFEAGQEMRARVVLDKYLVTHTNDPAALVTRARLLANVGEAKAAAADFTQAIGQLAEPMPEYYLERAQASVAAGEIDQALRGLDEGVTRLGPLIPLQLYAVELELARKHYDDVLARLETISARSQRKETWLARRGEILLLAGRKDEAQKSFGDALRALESLPLRLQQSKVMVEWKERVNASLRSLGVRTNAARAVNN